MRRLRQFVSEGNQQGHLQTRSLNLEEREVPCKEREFKAFTGMKAIETTLLYDAAG